jgi:formate/nitrite transporter FocA (FNT family)
MSHEHTQEENEHDAEEVARLRVPVVYESIRIEGEEELSRSVKSLWWSGIAAGMVLYVSIFAKGAFYHYLGDGLLVHLGYCLGFLMVILGRLQLFTENTITAVLPLLRDRKLRTLIATLRLWLIVFAANLVGMFVVSAFYFYGNILPEPILQGITDISRHYVHRDATEFLLQGIPAGFILACIVWMLPSARGSSEFWVIMSLTYLISLGDFAHVIAGSGEVFHMVFLGELSVHKAIFTSILPSLAGNVIGGTLLFAVLVYAQVKDEISTGDGKHKLHGL